MDTVHVIVMSDARSFVGMLALANSITRNTKSDVMFHFVTYPEDVITLRSELFCPTLFILLVYHSHTGLGCNAVKKE